MTQCGFVPASGVATPSEQGSLDRHLGLRDTLRSERSGYGGVEVCRALTSSLDGAIHRLVSPLPEGVAVVAIGGYGRAELSPYSDVDLMLLHSVDDPSEPAAALFRPLWDAKLRVGHSVRTVEEASAAAKERFDTHTTLLTSRLVAGDEDLFAELVEAVTTVTRARPLRRYLVAEERERRRGTPHLLMATDVKVGRGGLRTIHGFEWEERREALIGRFSTNSAEEREESREALLRVRNGLHVVTGRAHDVFSADLRDPVARWLGLDTFETSQMLVEAMQTVDRLTARRWPEVVDDPPKGAWRLLMGRPPQLSATTEPSVDELIWMLETGERGRLAFERLWQAGLLDDFLPEWGVVRALPQLAPFHEHPVASHLWRATDEMGSLIADDGHYGRVAQEFDDSGVLLLSAFLHDIGKGHGGDHASVGAEIARSFCERTGVDAERSGLIEDAVRHHLLLSRTATRRDLDDPAVIDEVAGTVGGLRLLQALYLLTVADSKATGRTMWSNWKASLLRTLFVRCAARFEARSSARGGTTRDEVLAAAGSGSIDALEAHLDGMPGEYLRSAAADDILWHLQLILEMDGLSSVGVRPGEPAGTAVVVGLSRPGFRCRVAEVFASSGVDVLEARMHTRADGVVVDTFNVADDRTGGGMAKARWATVRSDLEAGLVGDLDTARKLAERAAAYETPSGDKPVARGEIDPATGDLVVTIKCSDRIGRLAEILAVLNDCGLGIRLAKIDARQGEAIDTFHVDAGPGLRDPAAIRQLEHRIAGALAP